MPSVALAQFNVDPWQTLAVLLGRIFTALQEGLLDAWVNTYRIFTEQRFGLTYVVMIAVILAGALLALLRIHPDFKEYANKQSNGRLIWLGLLVCLAAMTHYQSGLLHSQPACVKI